MTQIVSLLSALVIYHANVLTTVLFYYNNLFTKPCMTSKQSSPPFSVNCNKTLLNRNIFQFTPRNVLFWDFTKSMYSCDWLKIPKFSQRNIKTKLSDKSVEKFTDQNLRFSVTSFLLGLQYSSIAVSSLSWSSSQIKWLYIFRANSHHHSEWLLQFVLHLGVV
jgi:hypothetical protein